MLDEPINGLDPDGVLWVRHLLRSLADEGRTVFVSSHLMSEVSQTADHLIVIGRGQLVADVPTEELLRTGAPSVTVRADPAAELGGAAHGTGRARRTTLRRAARGPRTSSPATSPRSPWTTGSSCTS